VCIALAASLLATRAMADAGIRLAIEWDKLGALLHPATVPADVSSRLSRPGEDRPIRAARPEAPTLLDGLQGPGRWSLVARDWEAARLLMGRLTPTDEVKRGRSKRMVLLRGQLVEGPVVPFAQIGLGQWRIDPDMPAMPHDALLAGQVGVGVELAVASWVSIALEADCTWLDPARLATPDSQPPERVDSQFLPRDPRWVHPPELWGSFLAARARF
jgi:hypothetical protein